MNWMPRRWAMVAAVSVFAGGAQASVNDGDATESPYRIFSDRNPFNIRPAPVQTNAVVAPKEQSKVDLKLTGITLFGKPKAYFQITEQAAGNKPAKTEFVSLGEAEMEKGLEVLDIDEVSREVRIRQEGVESLVTFASHGIAAPVSTGLVPTPGAGGVPVPGMGAAAGVPLSANAAANVNLINAAARATPLPGTATASARALTSIPSRPLRTSATGGMDPALAARYGLAPGAAASSQPLVRAPETPAHNLSTEEQQLLLELQRVSRPDVQFPPTPGLDIGAPPAPGGVPAPMPTLPGMRQNRR